MESSIAKQERYQYQTKQNEKYCKYCGKQLVRKRFNGRMEDFKVFCKRQYCDRECMKRGFVKTGLNEQKYRQAHQTAKTINELILKKNKCEICGSEKNLDIHHKDKNWKNNNLDNLMCLCRSCHMRIHRSKCINGNIQGVIMNEYIKLLKKYRKRLTRQQLLTLRGQILSGDIEGFRKGLQKVLSKKYGIIQQ